MNFMLDIDIKKLPQPINYHDKILLIGSCFTEHIGNSLKNHKFKVLQNPNGILFDPDSVCRSLISYIDNKPLTHEDIFSLNDVWNSWDHHSRFSDINDSHALEVINAERSKAHTFLKEASWIIITLGSSFSYRLNSTAANSNGRIGKGVANCHRAPAQWFTKHMLSTEETITLLDNCYHQLKNFNPDLKIIFTVSPVRHIRDGVVENNRSKARLIEAVHHMTGKFDSLYYFPAYELVIDVLRDYRFYDIDLVHPNYMATEYVLEKFVAACVNESIYPVMEEVKKIMIARKHRAFQPDTDAHRQFLRAHAERSKVLMEKYSYLDLNEELNYFNGHS